MKDLMIEIEQQAKQELQEEKVNLVKGVIKERIREIEKTEKLLAVLKNKYSIILNSSIDEIADGVENGNIRF